MAIKNLSNKQIISLLFGVPLLLLFFSLVFGSSSSDTAKNKESSALQEQSKVESATDQPEVEKGEKQPPQDLIKVKRVVDGDTIELETGEKVRYIGIDTPETVDPNTPVQCYGKEANERNKNLVEGKEVLLEKDFSEKDQYGRLLRYVWVGDLLVNDYLVREGYAYASSFPPDVKYQDRFTQAQQEARQAKRGLWGDFCLNWDTPTPSQTTAPKVVTPVPPTTPEPTYTTPVPAPPASSWTCSCSKTCDEMASCEEAYYQLNTCGCTRRDGDKDGIPCEEICR